MAYQLKMAEASKWTDESTREFIQLRFKLRHLFNGKKHECANAYKRIVDELGLGNAVTATQARKKWSNLVQKYKDIKGGYSTSNTDWPYFQMLDTVVPLMRKEAIESGPSFKIEHVDIVLDEDAGLPGTANDQSLDVNTYSIDVIDKSEGEPVDEELHLKKPRLASRVKRRQAAQKAREKWWGAVEDEEICSDSGGSLNRGDNSSNHTTKSAISKDFDATDIEIQTFKMLKSCTSSLLEIKETLKTQSEIQNEMMKKLTESVTQQGETLKNVLLSLSSQNAALMTVISRSPTDGAQSSAGLSSNTSNSTTFVTKNTPHDVPQDNQLLTFTTKFE